MGEMLLLFCAAICLFVASDLAVSIDEYLGCGWGILVAAMLRTLGILALMRTMVELSNLCGY